MIRPYLRNPVETGLLAAMLAGGFFTAYALAAAAVFFCGCEIAAGVRRKEGPRWWPGIWPEGEGVLTILYDSTCVLCMGSKKKLEAWKTASRMRFVSLQTPEARELLPGISSHYSCDDRWRGAEQRTL